MLIVPVSGSPSLNVTGELDYGTVLVGTEVSKEVLIRNPGARSIAISVSAPPELSTSASCDGGIPAGGQCVARYTWAPKNRMELSGRITVQAAGQKPITRPISGTAIAGPQLSTVGQLSFGRVPVQTQAVQVLTLRNEGDKHATVALGAIPSDVSISGDCTSIAPNSSCTLTLTWTPSASAPWSSELDVSSGPAHTKVALSGEGYVPLQLTGGGSQSVGSRYTTDGPVSRSWAIQNQGSDAANLSFGELSPGMSREGSCGLTLEPGATCSVVLTWAPSATASLDHEVLVSGSAGSQVAQVSLRMTGSAIYAFAYNPTLGSAENWDLNTNARAAGWNGEAPLHSSVTIASGSIVGSLSNTQYALVIPDNLPMGSRVTLVNHGSIFGQGGAGGNADSWLAEPGGPALYVGSATTIYNYGVIAGGGGGGGASASTGEPNVAAGGAGGGGGQGYGVSRGGTGLSVQGIYPKGGDGMAGGQGAPGIGGAGTKSGYYPNQNQAPWYATSKNGGGGGSWGSAGVSSDYPGGAAGAALRLGSVAPTWGATGAIYGPVW